MHDSLTDDEAERILTGVATDDPVGATIESIRHHFNSIPAAKPSALLQDFVSVPVAETPPPSHKIKEKKVSSLSAFAGTLAGKILIGASVATASVGGAHATGTIDIPVLPEVSQAAVETNDSGNDSVSDTTPDDSGNDSVSDTTPDNSPSTTAPGATDNSGNDSVSDTTPDDSASTTLPDASILVVEPRTFTVLDAGSVTISGDSVTGLRVDSVDQADGWTSEIEQDELGEAGVNFRRDGERVDFRAEIEHGQLRIRIRDRRTDTIDEQFFDDDGNEVAKHRSNDDGDDSGHDSNDDDSRDDSTDDSSGRDAADDSSGRDRTDDNSGRGRGRGRGDDDTSGRSEDR